MLSGLITLGTVRITVSDVSFNMNTMTVRHQHEATLKLHHNTCLLTMQWDYANTQLRLHEVLSRDLTTSDPPF